MGSVCFFFFCFYRQTAFPLDLECGVRIYSISLYVFNNNAIKHGSLFLPLHKIHTFHCYDFPIMYKSLFAYILYLFWAPWTAHSLGPSCIPGGGVYIIEIGSGGFPSQSFFPLLPNQIILFQLLKSFSFVCNGKVIIFRFVFL